MNLYRIYRFGVIKQNQFFLLAHLIFNFRKLVTFIDIISRTLRLFWEVELRRKFWILFKLQNYLSGVAVETGILQKIFNRFYTLDYLIRDEIKLDDYCQYLNGFFSNCTTTISVWEITFNTSGIYKSISLSHQVKKSVETQIELITSFISVTYGAKFSMSFEFTYTNTSSVKLLVAKIPAVELPNFVSHSSIFVHSIKYDREMFLLMVGFFYTSFTNIITRLVTIKRIIVNWSQCQFMTNSSRSH